MIRDVKNQEVNGKKKKPANAYQLWVGDELRNLGLSKKWAKAKRRNSYLSYPQWVGKQIQKAKIKGKWMTLDAKKRRSYERKAAALGSRKCSCCARTKGLHAGQPCKSKKPEVPLLKARELKPSQEKTVLTSQHQPTVIRTTRINLKKAPTVTPQQTRKVLTRGVHKHTPLTNPFQLHIESKLSSTQNRS